MRCDVLGLVLMISMVMSGCRQEPRMVVRLTPEGGAADVEIGRRVVGDVVGDRDECRSGGDCVVEPADCCGCTTGGRAIAVARDRVSALRAERERACAGTMCAQVMSNDPSCFSVAVCRGGRCALEPRR